MYRGFALSSCHRRKPTSATIEVGGSRPTANEHSCWPRAVDTPVFVATHHYPQRFNLITEYPSGVPRREAKPFLDALDKRKPGSVIACGHTHRHHRRHYKSLLITEIGSTKDYPGVWAGYVVYEGGIRQVVHRVAEPSARAWTDRTGRALFGLWRWWAPGLRSHRCWTWEWR